MVDALEVGGDEGRGVAAISLGELLSKLWSGDFRMWKHYRVNRGNPTRKGLGGKPGEVKHFSTQRKRKIIFIPLVVASEKGRAQTEHITCIALFAITKGYASYVLGVVGH